MLLVCLLALTYTVYAAPATTQKSTQQAKPATSATSPASVKYDPNAPPQGTITINASSKGNVNASTWYTGSYQYIQWTCKGIRSNLADVTLWQNNRQVANIWTGSATGQTAYVVPLSMAAGSYEVRVTSEDDTRIEARFPVNVVVTSVTLATPPGTLLSVSPYTITWTYTGTIVSAKLSILDSSGAVVKQSIPNISAGSNGKQWPWTVPTPAAGKASDQYRFQISGTFLTSAASSAKTDAVLGASDFVHYSETLNSGSAFYGMAILSRFTISDNLDHQHDRRAVQGRIIFGYKILQWYRPSRQALVAQATELA